MHIARVVAVAALGAACGGPTSAVEGTVVNRYGSPIAGARVRLGTGPIVTTDSVGRFPTARSSIGPPLWR
jgi:hypothetical protein